jgi:hypothetical protein
MKVVENFLNKNKFICKIWGERWFVRKSFS